MTTARHIQLAQNRTEPTDDERDLMTLARLIDKDAWRLPGMTNAYTRRLRSIEAAANVIAHQDAARAAMAFAEPSAPTFLERVRAWFGRVEVAS